MLQAHALITIVRECRCPRSYGCRPGRTALFAADISSREYATFAIALFAARLAHGFVESGAMRRVPQGVAADNVAFVAAHAGEIAIVARQLKLQ